ncbi:Uncharacterized protein Fot_10649 [Forsythia ovata]|uniref:Uncharacterized protein n=1 Tax=Forsythia ovata TaxID=205694 RepID=A0ABD1WHF4_9LAMI
METNKPQQAIHIGDAIRLARARLSFVDNGSGRVSFDKDYGLSAVELVWLIAIKKNLPNASGKSWPSISSFNSSTAIERRASQDQIVSNEAYRRKIRIETKEELKDWVDPKDHLRLDASVRSKITWIYMWRSLKFFVGGHKFSLGDNTSFRLKKYQTVLELGATEFSVTEA